MKSRHTKWAGDAYGGTTTGNGVQINWQDGPIGTYGKNGAEVEDVIEACIDRLRFYSRCNTATCYHKRAITHLDRDWETKA